MRHTSLKRICFLLNNEFVSDNRVKREAESLVKAGYDVTLIAQRDPKKMAPDFEIVNGVKIDRIIKKKLPFYETFNYNTLKTLWKIVKSYKRFDFVHAHDANTLLIGWFLTRLHKAKLIYDSHELWESVFAEHRNLLFESGKKIKQNEIKKRIFNFKLANNKRFEISSFIKVPNSKKKLKQLSKMEQLETNLLPYCDAIISVNHSICNILQNKIPCPNVWSILSCLVHIMWNFYSPSYSPQVAEYSTHQGNKIKGKKPIIATIRNIPSYFKIPNTKLRLFHYAFNLSPETKVILYQGLLADIRGIPQLLKVMEQLKNEKFALVLMGGTSSEKYKNKLLEEIDSSPIFKQSVFYKEPVYGDNFLNWTSSADLGIFTLPNCRLSYYYALPNKLFEYIQAGLPVAVSNFPEMKNIVETYGIGFTFDPENSEEIAQKICHYFNSPESIITYSKNIKQAKKDLCWENEEKKFIKLYHTLDGKMENTIFLEPEIYHNIEEPLKSTLLPGGHEVYIVQYKK